MRIARLLVRASSALCMILTSAAGYADDTKLAPKAPLPNLDLYVKVRDSQVTEYCATEKLGPESCAAGATWEAKDECAAPYKVAAVSCALANFNYEARLVANQIDRRQVAGSCIWAFAKLPPDKAPQATTTLLCAK